MAVEIKVKSLVVPLDLNIGIDEIIPNDVTVLSITPVATVSGGAVSWIVVLDVGEETGVRYTAQLPATQGTIHTDADITYLIRGIYREFATIGLDITTSPAQDDLATAKAAISQIIPLVPSKGGQKSKAQNALNAVDNLMNNAPMTAVDRADTVANLLKAIDQLTQLSGPNVPGFASTARTAMARVVIIYSAQGLN